MKLAKLRLSVAMWVAFHVRRGWGIPRDLTVFEYVCFLVVSAAFIRWMIPYDPMTRMVTGTPIWFAMSWWLLSYEEEV